tara:strand:- start:369 stop:1256 length:888 start_codon:yes stop_codon:yes gene_type:complete
MKILVLGCKGQLGRCLNDQLSNTNHEVIYTSREQIDITDFKTTKQKLLDIAPDAVINATAFTAVDKAEKDQKKADLINHLAVENIANICDQQCSWLIHVSTDYVFDGNSNEPYKEDDQTNPKGVYGKTKLNGELAIQSSGCKYIIIRTAWVFSEYGENFLKTMIALGQKKKELQIVSDQIGCPTYAQDIANTICKILSKFDSGCVKSQIFHFAGNKPCSWYDFALSIFKSASDLNIETPKKITPVSSEKYPTLAARPHYSVLDSSKIKKMYSIETSNWKKGIESSLISIFKNSPK